MDKNIATDENGVIVTDGLVLREITLNENDRLLTVLTGEYGRMTVLARGVKVTGATVHFVDAGTDTGPIILQKAVKVKDGDTSKELQRRVMEKAEWKILPEAINLIANDKITVTDGIVSLK